MAETKRADVLAYLENANMIEISELITEIEEKFGVTAAAPAVAVAAAGGGEAQADEKDEFDVMLTSAGSSKINVIKTLTSFPVPCGSEVVILIFWSACLGSTPKLIARSIDSSKLVNLKDLSILIASIIE